MSLINFTFLLFITIYGIYSLSSLLKLILNLILSDSISSCPVYYLSIVLIISLKKGLHYLF
jgi:hypothetical protein